jgi:Uncharacterized protein related to glutamine synthetase
MFLRNLNKMEEFIMEKQKEHEIYTDYFGKYVFSDVVMRQRIPEAVYRDFRKTVDEGLPLTIKTADVIADAMMQWAVDNGATHYTHWFQPLTGMTAEKHDSFISPAGNGMAINEFSGKSLIKGEPDASSFPSGGLRSTFEARGYTAWDCTSPAFLKHDASGVILCIPTAFCSYTGFALDKKTPLLKATESVSKQALRVLRLFGNTTTKKVITTVGAEQEYFLVDRDLYEKRLDLGVTGRTLFGAKPPKAQEMEDHYFGTIKERVACFMHELDKELWRVGVYAKTEHNEVAPSQHELAPIYTDVNIATDHNQIIMEMMKRVAEHHGFACLLHEKPFAGVNGSGKHNNWAIATDDGINLLDPGSTPQENAQFLLFLCSVIKAVDEYASLLRASAANAGNDHRLGGFEAPPAIISMFLGDQLTKILDEIGRREQVKPTKKSDLEISVATLPDLPKDATDRNRTSPFAFTGNKFEFRMVGSSASIAGPNTVLNTIIADTLEQMANRIELAKDFDKEVNEIIVEVVNQHKKIIFNGNGYAEDWIKEAEKIGLPNITNSIDAYREYISDKAIAVFERQNVYSKEELYARYEIKTTKYTKTVNIEARCAVQMAKREILPACIAYSTRLAENVNELSNHVSEATLKPRADLLNKYVSLLNKAEAMTEELENKLDTISQTVETDFYATAVYYRDTILPAMETLRQSIDELETMTDKERWPMPTYSDLIL